MSYPQKIIVALGAGLVFGMWFAIWEWEPIIDQQAAYIVELEEKCR